MREIAKTELTEKLEKEIYKATKKQGVFGCFEVTIGWFGNERVDYMTFDTKGIWRCYEVKVSVSDFRSKSKKTFCGHYNYYVMPRELFDKVKDEIPPHIGVYVGGCSVKRAKKQELGEDEQTLKDSLIRSLSRETDKVFQSNEPSLIDALNRRIRNLKTESDRYRKNYWHLMRVGQEKYGDRWYKEDEDTVI
ncbi:hypothetical protein [Halobacillus trueperi]|uniref:hypothetical protein n=1 Tax=Halobacillus trueperi TaxID=156205 RepID=UPI0021627D04|nr:hypothetical protein [Halobacillus trueperi]